MHLAFLALRKTSFHGEFLTLWTWTLLYSSTAFFSPTFSWKRQLKGTWQRGGFSGVFAEIGSA
jgi:hypothetical protein